MGVAHGRSGEAMRVAHGTQTKDHGLAHGKRCLLDYGLVRSILLRGFGYRWVLVVTEVL